MSLRRITLIVECRVRRDEYDNPLVHDDLDVAEAAERMLKWLGDETGADVVGVEVGT